MGEIQKHTKNDLEQSYWLIRLTTIIYWIYLYYPQKMIFNETESMIKRHDTFEPIVDDEEDENEDTNDYEVMTSNDIDPLTATSTEKEEMNGNDDELLTLSTSSTNEYAVIKSN